jgi:hypothetical protein
MYYESNIIHIVSNVPGVFNKKSLKRVIRSRRDGQNKKDKQLCTKHYTENLRPSLIKTREVQTVPTLLVAPVVLLFSQTHPFDNLH